MSPWQIIIGIKHSMAGIIGEKIGMTHVFKTDGTCIPVTVLRVRPNRVVSLRTEATNGYRAVVLGVGEKKPSRLSSPEKGRYKDGKVPLIVKEFPLEENEQYQVGDVLNVGFFEGVGHVDVRGTSIAKGFQGVIKRYGMRGGPASHGSNFHRRPGSIGAATYPAKVWKGKKMPGRMGGEQVCVQSLEVVAVDKDKGALLVKGGVPGNKKRHVFLTKALKK